MKKALLVGIIGFAVVSLGIAATASAYETWDPCFYYGCFEPESGIFNTSINDNFSWNDNLNNNVNNISINNGFGGGSIGGGSNNDFPQCDDGYDNDNDGRVDYPSDSGCSSYNDNSERTSTTSDDRQCDDNRDNDGDGDYDYPEDRGCSSRTDNSENSDRDDNDNQCDDNRDNDGDGDEDYPEDRGCSSRTDNSENSDNNNDDEPEVTTRAATSISETSATLNGRVDGNGSNTRVWFEYSDDRDDVASDDETNEDSVGSGTTTFDDRITGLRRNTTYYFRAVAENSDGDDLGSILSFRTDDDNSNDDENQCDDNRDNDGDGDEDYPDDRGCSSRSDNSENSDGNDNDDDSNFPPFYTSTPATSVIGGQIYSYNADAISPNGRAITYRLTTSPSGMTINQFTGQVLWATTFGQNGTSHSVRLVAEDTRGNAATQAFVILVRSQTVNPPVNPPINPPVNPPVDTLEISNIRTNEVDGEVIVSFNTNMSARGSVRYGEVSELEKSDDFTYPFGQVSEVGQGTSHRVNLGPLALNQTYYIRTFATAGTRSDVSPEFTFIRRASEVLLTEEVAGTETCSDGLDNDRDGVADAADSDCQTEASGQVNGTFASALESFGAFLISPWFLLLVIIILIIYILVTRRDHEMVVTNGPIEIKS